MTSPLNGITVLDLTRVLSGPYCTMLLADMGARVIKVEQPGKGDDTRALGSAVSRNGESAYFLSINRNKESVTLDFKQPEGRALLDQLIAKSRRAGRELPAGHADQARARLRDARARSIRGSSTARSRASARPGRARKEPGYDAVMQAEGGLMSITGAADGPPFRLGVAIADIVSGHVRGAGRRDGAVRARAHRARTGGRHRDARRGRRAAHLSGRQLLRDRHGAGAARQPPSDDRAVRNVRRVGRRVRARRRQRRAVAPVLRGRRARPTTSGSRPTASASPATTSCGRSSPTGCATQPRAVLDRAADRGRRAVRIGARSSRRCSPIRSSPRAR